MDEKLVIAVIGSLVVASLSALGYLYKIRKEQKKALKEALFHLLEIWYAVRLPIVWNAKTFSRLYIDVLRSRHSQVQLSEDDLKKIEEQLGHQVEFFLKQQFNKPNPSLISSYHEVIRKLSGDAPILAFELSGNGSLSSD